MQPLELDDLIDLAATTQQLNPSRVVLDHDLHMLADIDGQCMRRSCMLITSVYRLSAQTNFGDSVRHSYTPAATRQPSKQRLQRYFSFLRCLRDL